MSSKVVGSHNECGIGKFEPYMQNLIWDAKSGLWGAGAGILRGVSFGVNSSSVGLATYGLVYEP